MQSKSTRLVSRGLGATGFTQRVVALAVCCIFTVQTVVQGTIPTSTQLPEKKSPKQIISEVNGIVVSESHTGKTNLVIIKDDHCNPEAQKNIAEMLDSLARYHGGKLVLGVEGGAGRLEVDFLGSYPRRDLLEKTIWSQVKKGIFSGADYFAIMKYPEHDIRAAGIETESLYLDDFRAFRSTLKRNHLVREFFTMFEADCDVIGEKLYCDAVKDIRHQRSLYTDRRIGLAEYIMYLTEQYGVKPTTANMLALVRSIELDQTLDYDEVDAETAAFVEALADVLSEESAKELAEKGAGLQLGKITENEYYTLLHSFLESNPQFKSKYPVMESYIQSVLLQESIDPRALRSELLSFEKQVLTKHYASAEEKELDGLREDIACLKQLLMLDLPRRRAPEAVGGASWCDLEGLRVKLLQLQAKAKTADPEVVKESLHWEEIKSREKTAKSFYKYALERDKALLYNMLAHLQQNKSPDGVMIVGGFHADGITRELRDKGISYSVVVPVVKGSDENNPYYSLMLDESFDSVDGDNETVLALPEALASTTAVNFTKYDRRIIRDVLYDLRLGDEILTDWAVNIEQKNLTPEENLQLVRWFDNLDSDQKSFFMTRLSARSTDDQISPDLIGLGDIKNLKISSNDQNIFQDNEAVNNSEVASSEGEPFFDENEIDFFLDEDDGSLRFELASASADNESFSESEMKQSFENAKIPSSITLDETTFQPLISQGSMATVGTVNGTVATSKGVEKKVFLVKVFSADEETTAPAPLSTFESEGDFEQELTSRKIFQELDVNDKLIKSGALEKRFAEMYGIGAFSDNAPQEVAGKRFMLFEYLSEHQNFRRYLSENSLDMNDVISLSSEIILALKDIHESGYVHADIKPENIMVKKDASGRWNVKLIDFGISKKPGAELGAGTLVYAAPEQLSPEMHGAISFDTDIFAVMLTIVDLFAPQTMKSIQKKAAENRLLLSTDKVYQTESNSFAGKISESVTNELGSLTEKQKGLLAIVTKGLNRNYSGNTTQLVADLQSLMTSGSERDFISVEEQLLQSRLQDPYGMPLIYSGKSTASGGFVGQIDGKPAENMSDYGSLQNDIGEPKSLEQLEKERDSALSNRMKEVFAELNDKRNEIEKMTYIAQFESLDDLLILLNDETLFNQPFRYVKGMIAKRNTFFIGYGPDNILDKEFLKQASKEEAAEYVLHEMLEEMGFGHDMSIRIQQRIFRENYTKYGDLYEESSDGTFMNRHTGKIAKGVLGKALRTYINDTVKADGNDNAIARIPVFNESLGKSMEVELIQEIGKGGMGAVYLARMIAEDGSEKDVVVKVALPGFQSFLSAESNVLSDLNKEKVVGVPGYIASGETDFYGDLGGEFSASSLDTSAPQTSGPATKAQYLVMDFIETPKESLSSEIHSRIKKLSTDGYLTPAQMVVRDQGYYPNVDKMWTAMKQITKTLSQIHKSGYIHRDLKTPNLLVDKEGNILITDFGLAVPSNVYQNGYAGTPGYNPIDRNTTTASDMFSLALTFFEMINAVNLGSIIDLEVYMPTKSPELSKEVTIAELWDNYLKSMMKSSTSDVLTPNDMFAQVNTVFDLWLAENSSNMHDVQKINSMRALLLACLDMNPEKRIQDASQLLEVMEKVEDNEFLYNKDSESMSTIGIPDNALTIIEVAMNKDDDTTFTKDTTGDITVNYAKEDRVNDTIVDLADSDLEVDAKSEIATAKTQIDTSRANTILFDRENTVNDISRAETILFDRTKTETDSELNAEFDDSLEELFSRTVKLQNRLLELSTQGANKKELQSLTVQLEALHEKILNRYTDNGQAAQMVFETLENMLQASMRNDPNQQIDLSCINIPVGKLNSVDYSLANNVKRTFYEKVKTLNKDQSLSVALGDIDGNYEGYSGTRLFVLGVAEKDLAAFNELFKQILKEEIERSLGEIQKEKTTDENTKRQKNLTEALDHLNDYQAFSGHVSLAASEMENYKSSTGEVEDVAVLLGKMILDNMKEAVGRAELAEKDPEFAIGVNVLGDSSLIQISSEQQKEYKEKIIAARRKFIPQNKYDTGTLPRLLHDKGRLDLALNSINEQMTPASVKEYMEILNTLLLRSVTDLRFDKSLKFDLTQEILENSKEDTSLTEYISWLKSSDNEILKDLGSQWDYPLKMTKMGDEIWLYLKLSDGRTVPVFIELDKFNAFNAAFVADASDYFFHHLLDSIFEFYDSYSSGRTLSEQEAREFTRKLNNVVFNETTYEIPNDPEYNEENGYPMFSEKATVTYHGKTESIEPVLILPEGFKRPLQSGDVVTLNKLNYHHSEKVVINGEKHRLPLYAVTHKGLDWPIVVLNGRIYTADKKGDEVDITGFVMEEGFNVKPWIGTTGGSITTDWTGKTGVELLQMANFNTSQKKQTKDLLASYDGYPEEKILDVQEIIGLNLMNPSLRGGDNPFVQIARNRIAKNFSREPTVILKNNKNKDTIDGREYIPKGISLDPFRHKGLKQHPDLYNSFLKSKHRSFVEGNTVFTQVFDTKGGSTADVYEAWSFDDSGKVIDGPFLVKILMNPEKRFMERDKKESKKEYEERIKKEYKNDISAYEKEVSAAKMISKIKRLVIDNQGNEREIFVSAGFIGEIDVDGNPAFAMEKILGKHPDELSSEDRHDLLSGENGKRILEKVRLGAEAIADAGYNIGDIQYLIVTEDSSDGRRKRGDVVYMDFGGAQFIPNGLSETQKEKMIRAAESSVSYMIQYTAFEKEIARAIENSSDYTRKVITDFVASFTDQDISLIRFQHSLSWFSSFLKNNLGLSENILDRRVISTWLNKLKEGDVYNFDFSVQDSKINPLSEAGTSIAQRKPVGPSDNDEPITVSSTLIADFADKSRAESQKYTYSDNSEISYTLVEFDPADETLPVQTSGDAFNYTVPGTGVTYIFVSQNTEDKELAIEHEALEVKWISQLKDISKDKPGKAKELLNLLNEIRGNEQNLPYQSFGPSAINHLAHILSWGEQIYSHVWENVSDSSYITSQISTMDSAELDAIISEDRSLYMSIFNVFFKDELVFLNDFEESVKNYARFIKRYKGINVTIIHDDKRKKIAKLIRGSAIGTYQSEDFNMLLDYLSAYTDFDQTGKLVYSEELALALIDLPNLKSFDTDAIAENILRETLPGLLMKASNKIPEDAEKDPLILNKRIYLPGRWLGAGFMGKVRVGYQISLDGKDFNEKAIKESLEEFEMEIIHEAEIHKYISLMNPQSIHVPTFIDYGYKQDSEYIVSELVNGDTMEYFLNKYQFSFDAKKQIAIELINALSEIHKLGLILCDLKPDNIMIMPIISGNTVVGIESLKLIDFGAVAFEQNALLEYTTLAWQSPEQAAISLLESKDIPNGEEQLAELPNNIYYNFLEEAKRLTPKSDIFTLGLILRSLFSDEKPSVDGELEKIRFSHAVDSEIPFISSMLSLLPSERPDITKDEVISVLKNQIESIDANKQMHTVAKKPGVSSKGTEGTPHYGEKGLNTNDTAVITKRKSVGPRDNDAPISVTDVQITEYVSGKTISSEKYTYPGDTELTYTLVEFDPEDKSLPVKISGDAFNYTDPVAGITYIFISKNTQDKELAIEHEALEVKWISQLNDMRKDDPEKIEKLLAFLNEIQRNEQNVPYQSFNESAVASLAHILAWGEQIALQKWKDVSDSGYITSQISAMDSMQLDNLIVEDRFPYMNIYEMFLSKDMAFIQSFQESVKQYAQLKNSLKKTVSERFLNWFSGSSRILSASFSSLSHVYYTLFKNARKRVLIKEKLIEFLPDNKDDEKIFNQLVKYISLHSSFDMNENIVYTHELGSALVNLPKAQRTNTDGIAEKILQTVLPDILYKVESYLPQDHSDKVLIIDRRIYIISEMLGEGNMGRVYKALQVDLDANGVREVAIKEAKNDHINSLEREKVLLQYLKPYSNEVLFYPEYFGAGKYKGNDYLVTDFIIGKSLDAVLKDPSIVTLEIRRSIAEKLVKALGQLHSKQIIHNDLKPENIMVEFNYSKDGAVESVKSVKVIDLGLSDFAQTGLMRGGTIRWYSPDQAYLLLNNDPQNKHYAERLPDEYNQFKKQLSNNKLSQKSDVFTLGLIFKYLFQNDLVEPQGLLQRIEYAKDVKTMIPVIDEMLSLNPDERPDISNDIFLARLKRDLQKTAIFQSQTDVVNIAAQQIEQRQDIHAYNQNFAFDETMDANMIHEVLSNQIEIFHFNDILALSQNEISIWAKDKYLEPLRSVFLQNRIDIDHEESSIGVAKMGDSIMISINLVSDKGEPVTDGPIIRTFMVDKGRNVIAHGTFYLQPEYRGKGIFKQFSSNSDRIYRDLGVDKITVTAMGGERQTGAVAMGTAAAGFLFDENIYTSERLEFEFDEFMQSERDMPTHKAWDILSNLQNNGYGSSRISDITNEEANLLKGLLRDADYNENDYTVDRLLEMLEYARYYTVDELVSIKDQIIADFGSFPHTPSAYPPAFIMYLARQNLGNEYVKYLRENGVPLDFESLKNKIDAELNNEVISVGNLNTARYYAEQLKRFNNEEALAIINEISLLKQYYFINEYESLVAEDTQKDISDDILRRIELLKNFQNRYDANEINDALQFQIVNNFLNKGFHQAHLQKEKVAVELDHAKFTNKVPPETLRLIHDAQKAGIVLVWNNPKEAKKTVAESLLSIVARSQKDVKNISKVKVVAEIGDTAKKRRDGAPVLVISRTKHANQELQLLPALQVAFLLAQAGGVENVAQTSEIETHLRQLLKVISGKEITDVKTFLKNPLIIPPANRQRMKRLRNMMDLMERVEKRA